MHVHAVYITHGPAEATSESWVKIPCKRVPNPNDGNKKRDAVEENKVKQKYIEKPVHQLVQLVCCISVSLKLLNSMCISSFN